MMSKDETPPGPAGAADIQFMRSLDHIRMRPGMYVGSTTDSRGLHHLAYKLIYNALDEARAGFCHWITVELIDDGGCRVSDDGRGIPVDRGSPGGEPFLERVLTAVFPYERFPP